MFAFVGEGRFGVHLAMLRTYSFFFFLGYMESGTHPFVGVHVYEGGGGQSCTEQQG